MVRVDVDLWPLTVTWIEGAITSADAEVLVLEHEKILARHGKHVNVFEGTGADRIPDALVRKRLAEFTAKTFDISRRWALGSAFVVPSAFVRGSITAIHWVSPPSIPTTTVSSYEEALDWCVARLRAGGVELGAALEGHLAEVRRRLG